MSAADSIEQKIHATLAKDSHRTVIRIGSDISVNISQSPKGKAIVIAVNVPDGVPVTVTES